MKTSSIQRLKLLLVVLVAGLCAGTAAYAFYVSADAVKLAADNRNAILAIFTTFIIGPIWVGYNRLSQLDKLDNLSAPERIVVAEFASETRLSLLRAFVPTGIVVLLAFVLLSAGNHVPYANWVFSVAMPALLLYFFRSLGSLCRVLLSIERVIADAIKRQSKQAARDKLIAALKKGRSDAPLKDDPHLSKYREILSSPEI